MSIAKKSIKWLVALFVVFALVLTAVFAAGNVARANAEPEEPVEDVDVTTAVIIEAADNLSALYPDLRPASGTRTITVKYYVEIPAEEVAEPQEEEEEEVEDTLSAMVFAPVLTYPGGRTVRPNGIDINTAYGNVVASAYISNYIAGTRSAFSVTMVNNNEIDAINGVENDAAVSDAYLFTATYTLAYEQEESESGAYTFGFAEGTEIARDSGATMYIPAITNPTFYVRSVIDVPVPAIGLVFNTEQQTGIFDADGHAFEIGELANDLYPLYYSSTDPEHEEFSLPTGFSLVDGTYIGGVNAQVYTGEFQLDHPEATIWRIPDGNEGYTYSTENFSVEWEIGKRAITVPVSAGTTYYYTGSEQSFEFSEDPLTDAAYITITGTPQTDVGEYTVTATLTYSGNTYWDVESVEPDVAAKTFDFVINPILVPVPTPADVTYTYNGEEQTFQWASTPDGNIAITGDVETYADEYTVSVSIPTGYAWNDEGHTTAGKTFPFVINKKEIPVPVANANLVYSGSTITGVNTTGIDSNDIHFVEEVGSTKSAINVGNYTAVYELTDNNNTKWEGTNEDTVSINWSIAKKTITEPASLYYNRVYNGELQDLEDVQTWYTVTSQGGTDAGEYDVTVTLNDTDNTQWAAHGSASYDVEDAFRIGSFTVHLVINKTATESFYGQQVATITVTTEETLIHEGDLGTLSYTARHYVSGTGYVTLTKAEFESSNPYPDADNYIIEAVYSIANPNYYVPNLPSFPYEIKKVTVTAPVLEGETTTFGYDGSTHGISFTEASLVDAALITFTGTQSATAVGNYTYTASLSDTNNYLWSDSTTAAKSFPWSITVKNITKPTPLDGAQYVYDSYNKQFMLDVVSAETGYYTVSNNIRKNAGTQTVTVSLKDKSNTQWADGTTTDLEFTFTVQRRPVNLSVSADAASHVYGNTPANVSISMTGAIDAFSCTYKAICVDGEAPYAEYNPTQFNAGLNVGHYTLNLIYNDINGNYDVTVSEPFAYEITKRQIEIPVLNQDDPSFVYNGTAQGISFFSGSLDDADYFTLSGINSATNVGNYTYTATLNDATNCEWEDSTTAAKNYDWSITTRYITVPTVVTATYGYDGTAKQIIFSDVDADYVDVTYDSQSAIGVYTDTTTVALKAAHAGNIAWDDEGKTTEAKGFTLTIEVVAVNFTIVPVYNNAMKTGTAAAINVYASLPEAETYRWFKFTGYTFDDEAVTTVSLDMAGETVYANYAYNVGAGDVDGDGVISTADASLLIGWTVGMHDYFIEKASDAWTATEDEENYPYGVHNVGLDANGNGSIRSNDVVAVREALATGRSYKVIVDNNGIIKVAKVNRVTVTTYEALTGNIALGNPVALGCDINAANEVFYVDSLIPVDIDLKGYRLTVKGFTLNTNTAGATLKIKGNKRTVQEQEETVEITGTIYTVLGISVTAPNGNVIVSDVNGYSYDGTSVNLAAYSSSLHIEDDVAFYIYKAQLPGTTTDYDDVDHFIAEVFEAADNVETIVTAVETLANTRIQETEDRMQDIKDIKASDKSEAQKATEINALDVKKAILAVPIDTHVVVEENAALDVEKLVVKAQANEAATEQDVVKTFTIELKNTVAEEKLAVDISEVKDDSGENTVYFVENINVSGTTSNVDIIKAQDQQVEIKNYIAQIGSTGYESLQDAITASNNFDVIKLLTNVPDGTGLTIPDHTRKSITIDFNGYTYTVNGVSVGSSGTETQAMHWSEGSTVTLKNGTFVISTAAATVPNATTGKIVKMAMQNYAALTVKNMTMDFSNIVVQNYPVYTGKDAPYSNLEIPLFNLNAGSMLLDNVTITMPQSSTKGILIEIPDAATIKNSTINGYVSLGQLDSNVTIVDSTVSGVVSYFAGYGVKHSGNVYRLGGVSVTNYSELQAALNAGAVIIDIENDFNAGSPIAVSKSTIINGYDHTITSSGNRIMNVTDPDLVITINDLTMTSATSERGLNIWDSATGSDITLNNVYIDAHLYAINYVNGADNATLAVNDSYLKGWGAINAHFNDSSVVVTNSTLYGINRTSDHTYGFNTVTIDGDSLHGAQEGEHGVDNTFVFDGCTIIAEVRDTHQDWISFQYAASGNTASVVVNNCQILDAPNGNDKTYAMSIQGTNNAVVIALDEDQFAAVAAKHFSITDNGDGTYTIMPAIANISYFGTAYNFYNVFENGWLEDTEAFTLTDDVVLDVDVVFAENRAAAIAVSGGTFEMNLDGYTISGNGKILLPEGVTCVTDSTVSIASIFEAPEGEVIIESTDADGNYIYAVGVAYVKTKAEFTAAVTAGAKKIVVCADINLSMYTYNRDMDITIDLNGHTLTTTLTGITFSAARTLNIEDSSENGTGAINSTGNYAINMGTSSTADTEINIYGGTLTGKTSAAVKVNDGTLNVYGGTLTCPAANKYAILNYQGYAGTVNIYDGTFTAAVAVANDGTGMVNIYGGSFSADPSDFVAQGYMAVEDEGTWTVVEAEFTITTFAELKSAIASVNDGTLVYPTLIIANDIAFEEELTISKSVYIKGDGEVKFIGYDASTKYDEAFYINVADEDQEITIDGIVFDHFCYYSNVANKTKATASAVKNAVAYITYGGDCPASTTLYVTGCQFLGTARDMINASSTKGCKGFIVIEDCYFDATDRLSSTLNMLSFYGNADAELSVIITGCTFKEASEANATWATSAIASFGNADITVAECEFIACQIGIAIDNTFDRLYSTSTYPVYYNTTVTYSDLTFTNCKFGYYGEFFVEDASEIPEEAELETDVPFTYGSEAATQFHFAAEYDVYEAGEAGEAQHRIYLCYYVKA